MRARLMHAAPAGAMVAVASNPEDIAEHLTALNESVDLAAINETGSCVVAGPEEAIRAFTDRLAAQGIVARRVRTSHGFHSQSMDAVLAPFAEYLSTVTLHAPRIPMLSNVTGTWMTDEEATDPESLGSAHPLHRYDSPMKFRPCSATPNGCSSRWVLAAV